MGFGTYRWSGAPDHVAALRRALDLGCSLVDTAPNYAPAEVRSRLGQVLAPHRSQVRIVSKGGYLPGGGYSLDAPFLRSLIHSEARTVGRGHLDAFLVHNPEHLLRDHDEGEALDRIGAAFAVCAEQVAAGTIGSFGVSSNVLATPAVPLGQHTVDDYARLATELGAGPALRYVQFPHNLVERQALENAFLDRCRALGVTTVGNRPLSPRTPDGPMRIADPPEGVHRASTELLAELVARPAGLGWLVQHWDEVASPDALDYVEGLVDLAPRDPGAVGSRRTARDLIAARRRELREAASARTRELVGSPGVRDTLAGEAGQPVTLRACQTYLRDLDHVLVGFRRVADVDQLAALFGDSGAP